MRRLIYISTARTAVSKQELDEILRVSRRNNQAVGVTGLLIVGGRRFLQALEGPSESVMTTYDRIKADDRHFAAVILSDREIAERSFSEWAMGYQPAGTPRAAGTVASDVAALIAPIIDPIVHAYFEEFAKKHAA
ncbi:Sensors of blue-light using FAD [Sphingomonas aurantiaca]|uniref:Sensors of blue-light using FAD n=1 Tax=Sphingomonas aurantiaca TaxID=185949 RepID=A0A5E8AEC4_9SPHN|nr:BLUF domain-containing protein [Sphingomonas aurantiaca]VVT27934.1 Sensors of blue-light using FAD [Sphingomonas aurantiaca]